MMTDADVLARLALEGWTALPDQGFVGMIGPFFSREVEGRPHFAFPTDDRHHNLRGVLQGGALMTFADRSLGASTRFFTQAPRVTTIQLDVSFIDAVQIGEVVEAAPELSRATRSVVFVRTELKVGARLVATAQGIWKILA
jgi:acyl-coenzyme A thioesterase PaaI-like protein